MGVLGGGWLCYTAPLIGYGECASPLHCACGNYTLRQFQYDPDWRSLPTVPVSLESMPASWKENLATFMQYPPMRFLLPWAVRLLAPRQRVGVALVVRNDAGNVLMLRHVFHPHVPWGLPGGWLKRNEDPVIGALRELREETGLHAVVGPVVHVSYDPKPPHIGLAYLAYANGAEALNAPLRLSGEILEAAWFPPRALPQPLLPFVAAAIAAAVREDVSPA